MPYVSYAKPRPNQPYLGYHPETLYTRIWAGKVDMASQPIWGEHERYDLKHIGRDLQTPREGLKGYWIMEGFGNEMGDNTSLLLILLLIVFIFAF